MERPSHKASDAGSVRRRSAFSAVVLAALVVGVALVAQVHRLLQGPAGCFLLFTHSAHVLRATGAGRSRVLGGPTVARRGGHLVSIARGLRGEGADGPELAAAGKKGHHLLRHTDHGSGTSKYVTPGSRRSRWQRRTATT